MFELEQNQSWSPLMGSPASSRLSYFWLTSLFWSLAFPERALIIHTCGPAQGDQRAGGPCTRLLLSFRFGLKVLLEDFKWSSCLSVLLYQPLTFTHMAPRVSYYSPLRWGRTSGQQIPLMCSKKRPWLMTCLISLQCFCLLTVILPRFSFFILTFILFCGIYSTSAISLYFTGLRRYLF